MSTPRRGLVSILIPLGAIFSTVGTSPAFADDTSAPKSASGWRAGARIGYTRPLGSFQSWRDSEIFQAIRAGVPVTLDFGYRPVPEFYLGVYSTFAPGTGGDRYTDICEKPGCYAMSYRFGVNLEGHFRPASRVDPWVGFGLGGDVSSLGIRDSRGTVTSTVRGFDFTILSLGFDVRATPLISFGPYVQYAFGVYTHWRVSAPRFTSDHALSDPTIHGWLSAGLRCTLWP